MVVGRTEKGTFQNMTTRNGKGTERNGETGTERDGNET